MKVYIVTGGGFPNGMASVNRIKCYAKAITHEGVKCEVVIFRRTEVYGKNPCNTIGEGVCENIPFKYIGGTPLRGSNVFIRRIHDWNDKRNTIKYFENHLREGDVVLEYIGNEVDFTLRLIKTVHQKNAVYVCDLCELPFGTGKETKSTIRDRKMILKKKFPIIDGVIPISDSLQDLVQKYISKNCKVLKVPIMVDFEKYELLDRSQDTKVPYIFHSGTLTEQKDGILGMIEAYGIARQKMANPTKFICTGDIQNSPHCREITKLIGKYQLQEDLVFLGYLSDKQLKNYLSGASLTIINKYETQQNQYCFSTKLGEYMAAGKPVIITRVGEAMNYVKNKDTAYIVKPENVHELAEEILEVFSNPQEALIVGTKGKDLCKKSFDYHVWGKPLIQFLSNQ